MCDLQGTPTWHTVSDRYASLQIHLQSLPGAAAQIREQFAVADKVSTKDFGDGEDKVPMGHGLGHFFTEPLAKLH